MKVLGSGHLNLRLTRTITHHILIQILPAQITKLKDTRHPEECRKYQGVKLIQHHPLANTHQRMTEKE